MKNAFVSSAVASRRIGVSDVTLGRMAMDGRIRYEGVELGNGRTQRVFRPADVEVAKERREKELGAAV